MEPLDGQPLESDAVRVVLRENAVHPGKGPEILVGRKACDHCGGAGVEWVACESCAIHDERCGGCVEGFREHLCNVCGATGDDPDGPRGVDLASSLVSGVIEVSGEGAYATFSVRADVDQVDLRMRGVTVGSDSTVGRLDDVKSSDLASLVAGCPLSTNMGDWLKRNL